MLNMASRILKSRLHLYKKCTKILREISWNLFITKSKIKQDVCFKWITARCGKTQLQNPSAQEAARWQGYHQFGLLYSEFPNNLSFKTRPCVNFCFLKCFNQWRKKQKSFPLNPQQPLRGRRLWFLKFSTKLDLMNVMQLSCWHDSLWKCAA